MLKKIVFMSIMVAVTLCFVGHGEEAAEAEEPKPTEKGEFTFIVQASCSPEMYRARFLPLADYLSETTGYKIKLIIAESHADYDQALQDVHFALQDSFGLWVHRKQGLKRDPIAIAVDAEGKSETRGVILVKADSDIKNTYDLRGKTVLFGHSHSSAAFYSPYLTLARTEIDIDGGLKSCGIGEEYEDNAMSVFLGDYDACVTSAFFVKADGRENFNFETDLRVLAETWIVPHSVFTVSKKVSKQIVEEVKEALLDWKSEEYLKVKSPVSGFVKIKGNPLVRIEKNMDKYGVTIK